MATLAETRFTPEQYLEFERSSDTKHEYCGGKIWAMSGGSAIHALIAANIIIATGNALRGGPCKPIGSDLRLGIRPEGLYTYPDVMIVCGKLELLNFDTVTNPTVIFEVLSPSTAAYDRGEKFRQYRSIPTLREYVLVAQDAYVVERYERQPDGKWLLSDASGLEGAVTLASVACTLTLADIYSGVDLVAS